MTSTPTCSYCLGTGIDIAFGDPCTCGVKPTSLSRPGTLRPSEPMSVPAPRMSDGVPVSIGQSVLLADGSTAIVKAPVNRNARPDDPKSNYGKFRVVLADGSTVVRSASTMASV